jgi:hypothetical protein
MRYPAKALVLGASDHRFCLVFSRKRRVKPLLLAAEFHPKRPLLSGVRPASPDSDERPRIRSLRWADERNQNRDRYRVSISIPMAISIWRRRTLPLSFVPVPRAGNLSMKRGCTRDGIGG